MSRLLFVLFRSEGTCTAVWLRPPQSRMTRSWPKRSDLGSGNAAILCSGPRLFGLNARGLDYLAPLLGFFSDERAEGSRRALKGGAAQFGDPCLQFRIEETGVDFVVELVDDCGRRVLWHANPIPDAGLIACHELAHGRDGW